MALSPNFQCVVKHQLRRNFFLRGVVSAAGFIRNDLSTEDFLEECTKAFASGYNLLVFPEGTRTIPGEKPKLVRGFANIALLSETNIQIVVIRCEPITLTRDKPWYAVPRTRPCFQVQIGDHWEANSYGRTPHRALHARYLTRNLESYYEDSLTNG
jgi:1-acyl-sn-glycerol-3-phosphate acyltransferase